MAIPLSPDRSTSASPGLLDPLTRLGSGEITSTVVSELAEAFHGAGVVAFLVDPTGKQLTVSASANVAPWIDDLALPNGAESGVIASCVASATPWASGQNSAGQDSAGQATSEPVHLAGVDAQIALVVPIAWPRARTAHGAIVLLSDDELSVFPVARAAQLIALAIDAEFEQRYEVIASIDDEAGLPDRSQLLAHLERVNAEASPNQSAALYRIAVRVGISRDPSDGELGSADLARVGAIIRQCLRPGDLVAHLDRADFAAVVTGLGSEEDAAILESRLTEAIAGAAPDSDHPLGAYEASIGHVAIDGLADGPTLLGQAAAARRVALDQPQPSQAVAGPQHQAATAATSRFSTRVLMTAMSNGQIQPWYQPIFELDSVRSVAVEALARWVSPDGEVISPGEFIPAIDEHRLMSRLTSTMLRRVVGDLSRWRADGVIDIGFKASVNISMSDLTGGMLPAVVKSLLDEFGLDPSFLTLELTETHAMADVEHGLAMLHQLRDLGIGLAIDDFGTGYSSLSYLSRLPVNIVKIDRAFVSGLSTRRGDAAIIKAVVNVAEAVDLIVLAEGIETEDQLDSLRDLGVKLGQGFLVSPAIRAEDLIEHLAQQASATMLISGSVANSPPVPDATR